MGGKSIATYLIINDLEAPESQQKGIAVLWEKASFSQVKELVEKLWENEKLPKQFDLPNGLKKENIINMARGKAVDLEDLKDLNPLERGAKVLVQLYQLAQQLRKLQEEIEPALPALQAVAAGKIPDSALLEKGAEKLKLVEEIARVATKLKSTREQAAAGELDQILALIEGDSEKVIEREAVVQAANGKEKKPQAPSTPTAAK